MNGQYHIVYKTTNLVNGKIYVGIRASTRLNDTYLGSGTMILKAIKKYGKKKFIRENLIVVSTREEAAELEALIVDEDWVRREDTYNLRTGGYNDHILVDKSNLVGPFKGKKLSKSHKENISKGLKNSNRSWTSESSAKLSRSLKDSTKFKEHIIRMSKDRKGLPSPKTSGGLNGMAKPCCVYGIKYSSMSEAINNTNWTKRVLQSWFKNSDVPLSKGSIGKNLDKGADYSWVGKTPRELGFYYETEVSKVSNKTP